MRRIYRARLYAYHMIFIIIQILLCIITMWMASYELDETLLVGGIGVIAVYGIITVYEMRRERWFFSPLVVYSGMTVFYLGITSLWGYACSVLGYRYIYQMGILNVAQSVPMALALGLIGTTSYYLGYKLSGTKGILSVSSFFSRRSPDFHISLRSWLIVLGGVWMLWVLKYQGISLHWLGNIFPTILMFASAAPFLILISKTEMNQGSLHIKLAGKRFYVALAAALLDLIFHGLRAGMRNPILILLFMFSWGYILQRESYIRSPLFPAKIRGLIKPGILLTVVFLLVIFIIIPFGKRLSGTEKEIPEKKEISYVIYNIGESFPREGVWALPARLAGASLNAAAACIELRTLMEPEVKVHEMVRIGVIPRILWPNKPSVTRGRFFSTVLGLGRGYDEKSATTATAMTPAGELYWSYGMKGVVLGMFLLGLMAGFTFKVFSKNFPLNIVRGLVVFRLITGPLLWYENDISSYYVSLIFLWVVFYPLSLIKYMPMAKPIAPSKRPSLASGAAPGALS